MSGGLTHFAGSGGLAVLVALAPLAACAGSPPISYSRQVRPVLSEYCFACHGPDENKRKAGLRLDDGTSVKPPGDEAGAVVPGDPEASPLIQRITSTDPEEVMPPPNQHKTLSPAEVELLKEWIRQGAKGGVHWSYEPLVKPAVPAIAGTGMWPDSANPVDAFIAQRLQREGLQPSPRLAANLIIRRIALDLTGLPPSLDELRKLRDAVRRDPRSAIDFYLSRPAYGEHWARQWLDLARYADSSGYPSDEPREIWAYRDWVIRAFNANLPYDQFTIRQLAGDLLPNPAEDDLIATAFHRNTMTQNEGGTDDEEFRNAAVIDRVNTTFAVWMGTTMACAQCHSHKYDPVTHKEYFQGYAFFNQSADSDKKDEAPLHRFDPPDRKRQREAWSRELATLEARLAKPEPHWTEGLAAWEESLPVPLPAGVPGPLPAALAALPPAVLDALRTPAGRRSPEQILRVRNHYVRRIGPATKPERDRIDTLTGQLAALTPVTVPVMQELPPGQRRTTRIQLRGNWQDLGEEVTAGTPATFPPLAAGVTRDRLALANWLVRRDNPLTARVAVNRLWESIFGTGIVRTSEEFGSQGELPVHPELLDWLAAEFMDSGWDLKHMLRLLLSSEAYRQDSGTSPALHERDPDNRLLARGPRFRPTGELLRDQALSASGLLSSKMYGPPVRPLAPNLGLTTAFGRSNDWTVSAGEDRHRRSVYTEVRRNAPYASFATFDAGNREVCLVRRNRTNTPLQALVTLNDPVFIEAHQAMARLLVRDAGTTPARLSLLYQRCLSREPAAGEAEVLANLCARLQSSFQADMNSARKLATEPLGPAGRDANLPELAAWTAVAGVVMNLDEFLMRR